MAHNEQWLRWAVELQALAQAGLAYTRDPYDKERFVRIREIAAEMVAYKTDIPLTTVTDLFCGESGYQTPKLDSRAAIIQDDKILLVQENDGLWSLPGGWVDVDISVAENIVKEVKEEAGLDVTIDRVVAIQDREKHNYPVYATKICKVFALCSVLGGEFTPNLETIQTEYFSLDALPPLASNKTTPAQIKMCFDAYHDPNWQTLID